MAIRIRKNLTNNDVNNDTYPLTFKLVSPDNDLEISNYYFNDKNNSNTYIYKKFVAGDKYIIGSPYNQKHYITIDLKKTVPYVINEYGSSDYNAWGTVHFRYKYYNNNWNTGTNDEDLTKPFNQQDEMVHGNTFHGGRGLGYTAASSNSNKNNLRNIQQSTGIWDFYPGVITASTNDIYNLKTLSFSEFADSNINIENNSKGVFHIGSVNNTNTSQYQEVIDTSTNIIVHKDSEEDPIHPTIFTSWPVGTPISSIDYITNTWTYFSPTDLVDVNDNYNITETNLTSGYLYALPLILHPTLDYLAAVNFHNANTHFAGYTVLNDRDADERYYEKIPVKYISNKKLTEFPCYTIPTNEFNPKDYIKYERKSINLPRVSSTENTIKIGWIADNIHLLPTIFEDLICTKKVINYVNEGSMSSYTPIKYSFKLLVQTSNGDTQIGIIYLNSQVDVYSQYDRNEIVYSNWIPQHSTFVPDTAYASYTYDGKKNTININQYIKSFPKGLLKMKYNPPVVEMFGSISMKYSSIDFSMRTPIKISVGFPVDSSSSTISGTTLYNPITDSYKWLWTPTETEAVPIINISNSIDIIPYIVDNNIKLGSMIKSGGSTAVSNRYYVIYKNCSITLNIFDSHGDIRFSRTVGDATKTTLTCEQLDDSIYISFMRKGYKVQWDLTTLKYPTAQANMSGEISIVRYVYL